MATAGESLPGPPGPPSGPDPEKAPKPTARDTKPSDAPAFAPPAIEGVESWLLAVLLDDGTALADILGRFAGPFLLTSLPSDRSSAERTLVVPIVKRPPATAEITVPGGRVVIGRARDADLIVECGSVSKHHASLLEVGPGQWVITDLHSTNGTRLDGRRLAPGVPVRIDRALSELRLGQDVSLFLASARELQEILRECSSATPQGA